MWFRFELCSAFNDTFDVSLDGSRFVVDTMSTEETPVPRSPVTNWTSELKKYNPTVTRTLGPISILPCSNFWIGPFGKHSSRCALLPNYGLTGSQLL
jgi:hypothetical protein